MKMLGLAISHGADPTRLPLYALERAVSQMPRLAEFLLERGVPADLAGPTGTTILHRFAGKGKADFARWLLDRGADPNRLDGQYLATPLAAAARAGHKAMVELLLERGVEGELAETTALAFAIRGGHDEIADILRRRGATH